MTKRSVYVDLTDGDPFESLMELAGTSPEMRHTLCNVLLMLLFQRELSEFIGELPSLSDDAQSVHAIDMSNFLSVVDRLPSEIHATIQPELIQLVELSELHNSSLQHWHALMATIRNKFGVFSHGPLDESVQATCAVLMDRIGMDAFHRLAVRVTRELTTDERVLFSSVDELIEPNDDVKQAVRDFLFAVTYIISALPRICMSERNPDPDCSETDGMLLMRKYAAFPAVAQLAIEAEWIELGTSLNSVNVVQWRAIGIHERISAKLLEVLNDFEYESETSEPEIGGPAPILSSARDIADLVATDKSAALAGVAEAEPDNLLGQI